MRDAHGRNIIMIREGDEIEFYFITSQKRKRWFYEIHSVNPDIKKDYSIRGWVEHCRQKNWWTSEMTREFTFLAVDILDKK